MKNTECGVYSCAFIYLRLTNKIDKEYVNREIEIPDDTIEEFRLFMFN